MARRLCTFSLTALFVLGGPALAADCFWTGASGVDAFWTNPNNWLPQSLPTTADEVNCNVTGPQHPVITEGMNAKARRLFIGRKLPTAPADAPPEHGELTMTGGTLIPNRQFFVGGNLAGDSGIFYMSGGKITQGDAGTPISMMIANYGDGQLIMTGGEINVINTLAIPGKSATEGTGGGKGILKLHGGLINTSDFVMYNVPNPPEVDITEGVLMIKGDATAKVNEYVTRGWITAFGGTGKVSITFAQGRTRVVAEGSLAARRAWDPSVADKGSLSLPLEAISSGMEITWAAGDGAVSHNVYFGTSYESVETRTAPDGAKLASTTYRTPPLKLGATYYWRVDEVAGTSVAKGQVWSFSTTYAVVEDCEKYTADTPNRAFQTWIDGYGFSADEFFPTDNPGNGTGMSVGHDIWSEGTPYTSIMETKTFHGGKQSMPLRYDSSGAGGKKLYSEAQRTFEFPQNWTAAADQAMVLTLYVFGQSNNQATPFYVGVIDEAGHVGTVPHSDAQFILSAFWREWKIDLRRFAAVGVDMTKIKHMVIGVGVRGNETTPGSKGIIYIDDIRLEQAQCVVPPPTDIDPASLDAQWLMGWLTGAGLDPKAVDQVVIDLDIRDNEPCISSVRVTQTCVFPSLEE